MFSLSCSPRRPPRLRPSPVRLTSPDGAPFRGAFVQARHAGLKMTVSVLSGNDGRYVVENLPAGEYRVLVKTVGYRADVRAGVKLEADQNAAYDFALQRAPIRWTDISIYQGAVLLPDARGKKTLFENCIQLSWLPVEDGGDWSATWTAGATA